MVTKHIFWQAFVIAVALFLIGLSAGVFIESSRIDRTQAFLSKSEISITDEQVRQDVSRSFSANCTLIKSNLFSFADRIYDEALSFNDYVTASKIFDEDALNAQRRYDLLRIILWQQSQDLKTKCNLDYHNLVYLYNYGVDKELRTPEQASISKLTEEIKYDYPDKVLLIPIAVNTNLSSMDLILSDLNITRIPAIIVDDKVVDPSDVNYETLSNIILDSNKQ